MIVDMRGSKWDSIKPLLKILQESFPCCIHIALIIKPDNFWQKQRTNFGSSKFEFEVRLTLGSHIPTSQARLMINKLVRPHHSGLMTGLESRVSSMAYMPYVCIVSVCYCLK